MLWNEILQYRGAIYNYLLYDLRHDCYLRSIKTNMDITDQTTFMVISSTCNQAASSEFCQLRLKHIS